MSYIRGNTYSFIHNEDDTSIQIWSKKSPFVDDSVWMAGRTEKNFTGLSVPKQEFEELVINYLSRPENNHLLAEEASRLADHLILQGGFKSPDEVKKLKELE